MLEVKDQIISCRACSLSDDVTPVPFKGAPIASLAVLGESPDKPAQKLMEDLLDAAGFTSKFASYLNVVSCPVKGAPPEESQVACKPNVQAQLDLIGPSYLLLAGGVPLAQYKPHLKLSKMRGRAFFINPELLAFVIYSPVYVMRKGGTGSQTGKLVLSDLLSFKKNFYDARLKEATVKLGDVCIMDDKDCEREDGVAWPSFIAEDGLPWCANHQELGKR